MKFMKYLRKIVYLSIVAAFSCAHAGSYEDFFVAIRNDNPSVLTNLLARGFDPNTRDPKGQPGLTMAFQQRAPQAAKALLAGPGIDVNALNEAGESALMMTALKGDIAGAQLLLERGAKVNQPGWSALHYAATGPEPKLVRLLLEHGAAVDAESPNGSTPLMMAAQYGSEDSASLLLERGADPGKRNERRLRAADFARLAGRDALAKRLETPAR
jgi:ankyrin repeat protein